MRPPRLPAIACGAVLPLAAVTLLMASDDAPFPVRNQLPFHLPFLDPTPRGAHLLEPRNAQLTLSLAYTNTMVGSDDLIESFVADDFATMGGEVTHEDLEAVAAVNPERGAFFLDGETMRVVLDGAIGIGGRLELGFELPLLLHTGGAFDSPIDNYHDLLDLPDGGRPAFVRDRYVAGYVGNGADIFMDGAPGGVHLGDVVITARAALARGAARWPAVTTSFSLKLPTGDPDRLDGSGSIDYGGAIQVSKRLGRSTLHGAYTRSFLGEWSLAPTLPLRDPWSLLGAYALNWHPRCAFVAQVLRSRGPLPYNAGNDLGRTTMEIAIGLRHHLGDSSHVEWAILENLTNDQNAPDVGLFLALSFALGRAGHPTPKLQESKDLPATVRD